jgi:hypothetical protein
MVKKGEDEMAGSGTISEDLRRNRMAAMGMFSFVPPFLPGDEPVDHVVLGGKERYSGKQVGRNPTLSVASP